MEKKLHEVIEMTVIPQECGDHLFLLLTRDDGCSIEFQMSLPNASFLVKQLNFCIHEQLHNVHTLIGEEHTHKV